jgi:hypothetical protein
MNALLAEVGANTRRGNIPSIPKRDEYLFNVQVSLVRHSATGSLSLRYRPDDLEKALWVELALSLTSDAKLKECAHCGIWFGAGPGTGRREDARFCSIDHQRLFNSLKRKGRTANA